MSIEPDQTDLLPTRAIVTAHAGDGSASDGVISADDQRETLFFERRAHSVPEFEVNNVYVCGLHGSTEDFFSKISSMPVVEGGITNPDLLPDGLVISTCYMLLMGPGTYGYGLVDLDPLVDDATSPFNGKSEQYERINHLFEYIRRKGNTPIIDIFNGANDRYLGPFLICPGQIIPKFLLSNDVRPNRSTFNMYKSVGGGG